MFASPLPRRRHMARPVVAAVRARVARLTRPVPIAVAVGAAADATRSRSDLLLENALLRHQLVVLVRTVKRPRLTAVDRGLLVLLASQRHTWADALVVVRPETVLRWHRQGCQLFWRRKSRPRSAPEPQLAAGTIALLRELAAADGLWGADRIWRTWHTPTTARRCGRSARGWRGKRARARASDCAVPTTPKPKLR